LSLTKDKLVILLAGGESKRTSTMKQLYKIDGEFLINVQIKKLLSYGYDVAVILGHNFENIKKIIDSDVKILKNENYKDGMFSSVKLACKELDSKKYLFCHIDRPIADKEVFEVLLNVKTDVAVAFKDSKKAPPIMINSTMKKDIEESSHSRLDHWIESISSLSLVDVKDEKVHFNANTDSELKRYFV